MNEEEKKTIENDISSRLCDYVNVALKFSYRDKEKHILQTIIKELQRENSELTNELKHISKLFEENTKRLETISRKLGLTKKNEYGFLYDEIIKEIDKLQKVINLMAEDRAELTEDSVIPTCKEAIIDFYYKKVEEENE